MTKADLIEFFNTYISPASPQTRAKIAVHLLAQKLPVDTAVSVEDKSESSPATSDGKSAELASLLTQVLSQMGLPSTKEDLTKALEKVNIKAGDSDGILTAISSSFSGNTAEGVKEKAAVFTAQGKSIIDSILPSLGIVPRMKGVISGDESRTESEEAVANSKLGKEPQALVIEDVRNFKAGMPLSEGLRAVRAIQEFEDGASKL